MPEWTVRPAAPQSARYSIAPLCVGKKKEAKRQEDMPKDDSKATLTFTLSINACSLIHNTFCIVDNTCVLLTCHWTVYLRCWNASLKWANAGVFESYNWWCLPKTKAEDLEDAIRADRWASDFLRLINEKPNMEIVRKRVNERREQVNQVLAFQLSGQLVFRPHFD